MKEEEEGRERGRKETILIVKCVGLRVMELTLLCYEVLKLGSDLVVLERSKKTLST